MERDEAKQLRLGDRVKLRPPQYGLPHCPAHDRVHTVKRVVKSGEEIETEEGGAFTCGQIERA